MLRSTALMTLALAFAAPAVAASPAPVATGSFEGQKFEYSTKAADTDKIVIAGKFVKSGEAFSFTVRPSGLVQGEVGDRAVSFRVSKRQRDALEKSVKGAAEPQIAEAGASFSAGTN